MRKLYFLLCFLMLCNATAKAQCISSFPYQQGFESGAGGWVSNGTGNDWALGTPSKAFITSAGGGNKCWVTGGLSGSFYTNGERAYVASPCFDFSTLSYPVISVKVYWDCENVYDGATFQSSVDNGLTWTNVGTEFDAANCMTANWFNNGSIINLSSLANPKAGWAGSSLPTSGSCQGGGGSGGWVTAKHCLTGLGGQANVMFRFAFGAGTTCNAFDGFAFDDVRIEESQPNVASFTYACKPSPNSYQFTNSSPGCPDTYTWNFGDPLSGSNNTSTAKDPVHTFSSGSTYTVTLTASGPCNAPSQITKLISMVSTNGISTSLTCANSGNGMVQANVFNATGASTFDLQPSGGSNTTGLFTGLSAGLYTIHVTDAIGCNAVCTISVNSPAALTWKDFSPKDISCNGLVDGSINAQINGGTGTINYTLLPLSISNTAGNFSNLTAGNYTVIASDANECTLASYCSIAEPSSITLSAVSNGIVSCRNGNDGTIQAKFSGGTGTLQYQITSGEKNTSGVFTNLSTGTYTIICSDINSCSASVSALVQSHDGPCCDEVFIPNAFSPNNDGKNDEFTLQNVNAIELLDFLICNRWGEVAFKAQNINDSWNGHFKGEDAETGTYYYFVKYRCLSSGKEYKLKGDVLLIR